MFINYHSIYLSVYEIVTLKVTDHCICGYGHPDSTRCNQLRRGLVPKKRNRLLPSPEKSVFAYSPQPAEGLSEAVIQEIGKLLHDRCEGNKLYLQTDLTSVQLAQALGTNRTYLGMYFSSQGTTYNAYINTLRINYFIELFRQASAAAEGQSIQAKHLANRSGYRSYRTFSVAFKQRTGQSVKDWIAEQESALQANKD